MFRQGSDRNQDVSLKEQRCQRYNQKDHLYARNMGGLTKSSGEGGTFMNLRPIFEREAQRVVTDLMQGRRSVKNMDQLWRMP